MGRFEELNADSETELCLKAAKSTYVVFSALLLPIAMLYVVMALRGSTGAWRVAGLVCAALGAVIVYFATMRVTISQGVLSYRSLFSRWSLRLADIAQSEIQWRPVSRDPRPFLVITSSDRQSPLRLNLKPFRREEISRLLNLPELKLKRPENVA
jgi:hypothetical protein